MAVRVEAVSFLSGIVVLHPFGLADGQLGHEIIGIAPVIGRGELDHFARGREGAALDVQRRALGRNAEQGGLFLGQQNRVQSLQSARSA